jgi:hypothetical protein
MRLQHRRATPENVVQDIWVVGRPGGLRAGQLQIKSDGDPARYLILQGEQIACVAIEALGPKMRIGLSID